jgi:hypothetical protein
MSIVCISDVPGGDIGIYPPRNFVNKNFKIRLLGPTYKSYVKKLRRSYYFVCFQDNTIQLPYLKIVLSADWFHIVLKVAQDIASVATAIFCWCSLHVESQMSGKIWQSCRKNRTNEKIEPPKIISGYATGLYTGCKKVHPPTYFVINGDKLIIFTIQGLSIRSEVFGVCKSFPLPPKGVVWG